jgi:hypothetical protein
VELESSGTKRLDEIWQNYNFMMFQEFIKDLRYSRSM